MKNKGAERGNPVVNMMKVEWRHLGNRKKTFIFVMFLFFIAGLIQLSRPLVIGLIFNTIL